MRILGCFTPCGEQQYERGESVVVRTDRGLEAGEVLCEATPRVYEIDQEPAPRTSLPPHDHGRRPRVAPSRTRSGRSFWSVCGAFPNWPWKWSWSTSSTSLAARIVVYYLAEGRINFRELVKVLASEFQTRIEMRQIGVRDEAKLMADFGDCGKAVCCNTHLVEMPPVSMRMAKLQKATLDPTKISGRCGRLKCCLRYEFDTYEEIQRELPPIGSAVVVPEGNAKVVGHELLAGQFRVETEDHRRKLVDAANVSLVGDGRRPDDAPDSNLSSNPM